MQKKWTKQLDTGQCCVENLRSYRNYGKRTLERRWQRKIFSKNRSGYRFINIKCMALRFGKRDKIPGTRYARPALTYRSVLKF